jgi:WD40 repeat protein
LIFDALNLSTVNVIEKAHKGSISTLAFSDDGTLLATSSTKVRIARTIVVASGPAADGGSASRAR